MNSTKTIGQDFDLKTLFLFALTPMFTQLMLSLLSTIDDGLFISRYIGANAMAGFSIMMPLINFMEALIALIAGCTILCAAKMGEGEAEESNQIFTTMAFVSFIVGLILALFLIFNLESTFLFLGATDVLLPYCFEYSSIFVYYIPFMFLSRYFSQFYMTAGKPKMSMITSLLMAVCNLLFDYIFIVNLNMGMKGVACANMIGSLLTIIIGFVFYFNKKQEVHFSSFHKHPKNVILNSFKLGIPGTFTFLALTVNSFVTNAVLMDVVGENAVAAKSIVNAIQFTFMSAYFGLFSATNPIISYNFGNRNKEKLRKSLVLTYEITTIVTIIIVLLYLVGIEPVKDLFLVNNKIVEIDQMVDLGLRVSPFAFFFFGFVIASEECFAALQNSKVSSIISAFENIIFSNLTVILLPKLFGINGFWFSFLTTEVLTSIIALFYILKCRDMYGYGKFGKATALVEIE